MRDAMAGAEPGLAALTAGLEASGRWCLPTGPLAQLLFWRPVPSFGPSAEAFAPSVEMVALQRAGARRRGGRRPARPRRRLRRSRLPRVHLITGVLTQAMANEPDLPWGQGRFTPPFPSLMKLLPAAYPATPAR